MDGTSIKRRSGAVRTIAFAAAMMLPAAASGPALAESGSTAFAASFAAVSQAETAFHPSPEAVDLTTLPAKPDDAESLGSADEDAGEAIGGGVASYYGAELAGHRTASGERFDPGDLTAAHRTLPLGSHVRVTNPSNHRSVIVRINDRGPFARGRVIDLSRSAAEKFGLVARGSGRVELALLD
jgi:rare lipoprotein A